MTLSIAESVTKDAIALLINLAERGEIDPWDVQVIDVVDRFLSRLIVSDRRDLYDSGQALLVRLAKRGKRGQQDDDKDQGSCRIVHSI